LIEIKIDKKNADRTDCLFCFQTICSPLRIWILDFWIFGFLDFWISGFIDSGFVVDINVLRGNEYSKFLLPKKLSTKIRLQEVVRLN